MARDKAEIDGPSASNSNPRHFIPMKCPKSVNNKNLETIIYNNPILSDCPLQNTECFELGCYSKSRLRSWSAASYFKEFWASSRWLRQLSLSMRSPQLIAATLSSFLLTPPPQVDWGDPSWIDRCANRGPRSSARTGSPWSSAIDQTSS